MNRARAFECVHARWLIALLVGTYVAASLLAASLPGSGTSTNAWYWSDIVFFYAWHASLALGMWYAAERAGFDLMRFVPWTLGRSRLASLLIATVMIYLASLGLLWLFFLPLVPIVPEFVQWWLIEEPHLIYTSGDTLPFWPNLLGFVDIALVTPVIEELFFRGFLLQRWSVKWGTGVAVAASTALFALLHVDPLGSALFGFAMCIFYIESGSLLAPILCHALTNAIAWTVALAERHVQGFDHVYSLEEFVADWWIGAVAGIFSLPWVLRFVAAHRRFHRREVPAVA